MLDRHVGWIEGDFALGFDTGFLHNVGGNAERFLDVFASQVLPRFAATA